MCQVEDMKSSFHARSSEDLGHALRQIRLNESLTQVELARKVASHQRLISRIETGGYSKTVDMIFRLCSALDVEIEIRPRQKTSKQDIANIFK